jgi:uncharacterized membrane protein
MTVQGWTGDSVNLFVTFPSDPVSQSASGFAQAIAAAGPITIWHTSEGFLLLVLAMLVLSLSIKNKPKSIRITALLGLFFIVMAGIGGLLFVFSGFQNNPSSAQMGGSFIGAYAFYFIELYYAK